MLPLLPPTFIIPLSPPTLESMEDSLPFVMYSVMRRPRESKASKMPLSIWECLAQSSLNTPLSGHVQESVQLNKLRGSLLHDALMALLITSTSTAAFFPFDPVVETSISLALAVYPTMAKLRAASNAMRLALLMRSILMRTLQRARSAAASSRPSMGDLFPLHPFKTVSTILTQCAHVMPSTAMESRMSPVLPRKTMGKLLGSPYCPKELPPDEVTALGVAPEDAPAPPPRCTN
mmetsp:Transcript_4906/g.14207  ORF Transcript_4906/g.14207 Transcript_4906/m.14207 type:complete len:234 (-) Transcript_4906:646-1347(-)